MSIKRQIQCKYRNFARALHTMRLPRWLNSGAVRLGLVAVIFLFGAAYIIKTASSATTGYQMNELEKQALALETEVRKLQVEIADNSSMNSISARLVKLNMTEAGGIKYLVSKNTSVAKN